MEGGYQRGGNGLFAGRDNNNNTTIQAGDKGDERRGLLETSEEFESEDLDVSCARSLLCCFK